MPESTELPYPVVYIRWSDSARFSDHWELRDLDGFHVIESVGFLVQETDADLTLARDAMPKDRVRDALCIPKVNVLARHSLQAEVVRGAG